MNELIELIKSIPIWGIGLLIIIFGFLWVTWVILYTSSDKNNPK